MITKITKLEGKPSKQTTIATPTPPKEERKIVSKLTLASLFLHIFNDFL